MKISEFPYTRDSLYKFFSPIGWAPLSELINQTGKLLVTYVHALFIFLMFYLRSCLEPPFLQLSSFLRLFWGVMDSLVLVVLKKTNQPSWSEIALVKIPLMCFPLETGSTVAKADLKLSTSIRMALSSSFCLSLSSDANRAVHHCGWFPMILEVHERLPAC